MKISEFQTLIEKLYYSKDNKRGIESTFMWFAEEVGELSRAIRKAKSGKRSAVGNLEEEFADCFAWLVTLASLNNIKMEKVIEKYIKGCPKCKKIPCICSEHRKTSHGYSRITGNSKRNKKKSVRISGDIK